MAKRGKSDDELLHELDEMDGIEPSDEVVDLLDKYGIEFVQKEYVERDATTGQERREYRGWIAKRITPTGRVEYAGPTLAWTFMGLAGAFASIEVAKLTVRQWCAECERQAIMWPPDKLVDVEITVPMAVNPNNELDASYAQVNYTPDVRLVMNALYQGLRQRNETVKGKPVSNGSDCLRWLLFKLQQT